MRADDLASELPRLSEGESLGGYTVGRVLGEGGMGTVYEARRRGIDKRVALKVMHLTRDPLAARRFVQEARLAAMLEHPHVVDCFDIGEHDGLLYIAMEYLEGESLAQRLRRGSLSLDEAMEVALPVCSALLAAHERGVVHRDVKPDNIFLTQRLGAAVPKLLDFGIAKARSEAGDPGITGTGTVFGTPGYMPPEQANGARHVTPASDQFALGVVLWESVAGAPLFEGDSLLGLLAAVRDTAARPVRALRPELPPGFEGVLARMLERDPAGRYSSMREVGAALLPFASERVRGRWAGAFAGARGEPPSTPPALGTAPTERAGPPAPRAARRVWLGLGLIAVAASALAASFALRGGVAPRAPQLTAAVVTPRADAGPTVADAGPEAGVVVEAGAPHDDAAATQGAAPPAAAHHHHRRHVQ